MTEQWLFPEKLTDQKNWLSARYISSYHLIKYIAEKEHLQGGGKLCQGTNLICDFGHLILKIFAPEICGYQAAEDFHREIYALQQLQNTELRVPHIVNGDCVHDRYDFYYLILERLEIPPAAQFVDTCTPQEMSRFGGELLNSIDIFKEIIVNRDLAKTRPSSMFPEQHRYLSKYRPCFVHADLSGDNILYDGKHLAIIDFEDWTYSAPFAEYPALIFELLHGDRTSIETFFSRSLTQAFLDDIFDGIICHYNWEQLIVQHCMRDSLPPTSLEEVRERFSI